MSRPTSSSGARLPSNARHDGPSTTVSSNSKRSHSSSNLAGNRSSSSHNTNNNAPSSTSAADINASSAIGSGSGNGSEMIHHQHNDKGKRRKSDQSDDTAAAASAFSNLQQSSTNNNGKRASIASAGSGHGSTAGGNAGQGGTAVTKVGPKRKSKVGISGLADHHHVHHHAHGHLGGMTRSKKSASSTALARKDKSRSHLALANIASELSSLAQMHEDDTIDADAHARQAAGPSRPAHKKTASSSRQRQVAAASAAEEQPTAETAAVATTAGEGDDDAGWISANSSVVHTPEYGASPVSPESYKALEFGKKARNKKKTVATAAQQPPPLEFPTYEQRQRLQRSTTEEEALLSGTTPRQRESALSLAAPNRVPSSANMQQQQSATEPSQAADSAVSTVTTIGNASASTASAAGDMDTPTEEKPDPVASSASAANATSDSTKPQGLEGKGHPSTASSSRHQHQVSASPDQLSQLPQPPSPATAKSRPVTQRKASTSTIRSLASIGGTRAPLTSTSFRRQAITPLEPRLDTSVEGHGEVEHTGLTPKQSDTPFPSITTTGAPSSGRAHRRTESAQSAKASVHSKAGTLSPKEAEELAKRLRTVSGDDLPAHLANDIGSSSGGARSALRRTASSAQGTTLASLQKYGVASPRSENPPGAAQSGGGALGTLKRASGYFGSIGRLTSLGSTLGLTSLGQDKDSMPSPSPSSPTARRTPSSGGSMAGTPSALMKSSPVQRLQNAYAGSRGYRAFGGGGGGSATQLRQPLISKFIDPSENYQPFPKASTSQQQQQSQTQTRGTNSRARQKLLTQRDYPDDPPTPTSGGGGSGFGGRGFSSSDEDPTASQVNLRKNLSSKNLSGSGGGAATPLQPGVQRWLVALSKEAERIDKEHATFFRFHDTLQASFARILERRAIEEQEELRAHKEGKTAAASMSSSSAGGGAANKGLSAGHLQPTNSQPSSRPSSIRSRTMA